MERVKGIEPSLENSQKAQNQPLSPHAPDGYTQGRAQIAGAACPELAQVVGAWANLPAPLKAGILAIVRSSEAIR